MTLRRDLRFLPLVAALAACEHTPPVDPGGANTVSGPLRDGFPLRLTYNPGVDADPVWLAGSQDILYSREHRDTGGNDRCIARLPSGGGAVRRELCAQSLGSRDSLDVYEWPAPAPDGSGALAYVTASSPFGINQIAPRVQALVLNTLDGMGPVRVLRTIPYFAPNGRAHQNVSHVGWLGRDALTYLAEHVAYVQACGTCPLDTLRTGLEIVKLDLRTDPPALTVLSGTDGASSAWPVGEDTVYLSYYDRARVYKLIVSSGQVLSAYDFGAAGVARDVQAVAGRLVAIVGGSVTYDSDTTVGPIARDHGGDVHVVDLATGSEVAITVPHLLFRHPTLAPAGAGLVVEGYPFVVDTIRDPFSRQIVAIDTAFSHVPDLWRFTVR